MRERFHLGELEVQAHAGVQAMAGRVGGMIQPAIPRAAQEFLEHQTMVVVGAGDPSGRMWASLLSGPVGFLRVPDEHTVEVHAAPVSGDPLGESLRSGTPVGLLAIEFETRRRMRINGRAAITGAGLWTVQIDEVYANCPKYIQPQRGMAFDWHASGSRLYLADTLTAEQQRWTQKTDSFFIASSHPQGGADASHRGGPSGFVHVRDARTLEWPDYAGNNLFQTFGNISVNPRSGLLFVDVPAGRTLQLTGQAELLWGTDRDPSQSETGRAVRFHLEQAVELTGESR